MSRFFMEKTSIQFFFQRFTVLFIVFMIGVYIKVAMALQIGFIANSR